MTITYDEFLREKVNFDTACGFERKGRRGRAAELNTGYFMDGVAHLKAFDREATMPSLFDLVESAS